MPSIVIGIFVFGLLVSATSRARSPPRLALAIIMLPLVARSTQEVLALVPDSLREASLALGVSRWRTVARRDPARRASAGSSPAATLAIARAAGETAPLLFTCVADDDASVSWDPRQPLQSMPLTIFEYLESARPGRSTRRRGRPRSC